MSLSPGSPAYWYTDSHVAMSSCSDDDTSSSTFEMKCVPAGAPPSPTTATTSKASSPAALPIGASVKQKAPLKPKSKVAAGPTPPNYPPPKGHGSAAAAAHTADKQHRSKRDKDEDKQRDKDEDKQRKRHKHHDRELPPEVREEARQQYKRE